MASSLQARLEKARRQQFVGRHDSIELLRSALAADELPFVVLYLFGPGGIGKTTLVREFAYIAGEMGVHTVYLDGRNVDPSPDLFQEALRYALNLEPETDIAHELGSQGRTLLIVDTSELLAPIDSWLRNDFLPSLRDNILIVLAGRTPPSLAWRTDPGWQMMMRIVPLRNLTAAESRDYLLLRGVAADQLDRVLSFTHGHALALSLVADVTAQHANQPFHPEKSPDIIRTLLEQLVQQVPTPAHREALEACALVQVTTESLLADLLDRPDVHELFSWLRDLSFMDANASGLFPHDLAREALNADLRWRNPDWYMELHKRARHYYMRFARQSDAQEQRRTLAEYIYLHRENPAIKPYFEWQISGHIFADHMRPADVPVILQLITDFEGQESAEIAALWLSRQPENVSVFRQASGEVQGVLMLLYLERLSEMERQRDPAVQAAWRYLQTQPPLRTGENATYFRFWLARNTYQDVSPVQSRIFLNIVQHYLTTPGLAYTFLPCARPEFWTAVFTYADLYRQATTDFQVGKRHYGVYVHDWRKTPPLAWLDLMAEREVGGEIKPPAEMKTETVVVLNAEAFANAVRDALKSYTDTAVLQQNPLIKSRLILAADEQEDRVLVLQKVLLTTAKSLQANPKQLKLYRALYHTYFQPAETQEQAAELLDLPFSTYRRHLRQGIDEVVKRLWAQEIEG